MSSNVPLKWFSVVGDYKYRIYTRLFQIRATWRTRAHIPFLNPLQLASPREKSAIRRLVNRVKLSPRSQKVHDDAEAGTGDEKAQKRKSFLARFKRSKTTFEAVNSEVTL
jgi:hypothetical protein